MQPINSPKKAIGVLMGVAIATMGASLPGLAGSEPSQLIAQDSAYVGKCRAVNRSTPVFSEASTASAALQVIAKNEQVTLAGAPSDGFVKISAPVSGYVQAVVLKACSTNGGTTPPPVDAGTCRKVIPEIGLKIRSTPEIKAGNEIGFAAKDATVSVTKSPPTEKTATGYVWVEIDSPKTGWVANKPVGAPNSNLRYCTPAEGGK